MKKLLVFVVLAFIIVGCTSNNNKEKILRIGTEGTYSPFTYHDNDGKLVGYDIEVITEAAKRAGYVPEFFETSWEAMFSGLNANRFDMIANEVSDNNKKRAELYTLSIPYITTSAVLAVKADNDDIKSLKDIKGKKIAQSMGSAYYETSVENGANIVLVDNLAPALKAVSQGRVDGTLNDKLAILNYLNTTKDKNVKIAFTTGEGTKSVFLFKKDLTDIRDKINVALKSMKEDGTLKKISEKYFGTDVSE